jgi:hypothetical protein
VNIDSHNTHTDDTLGTISLALGVAGLLPLLPIIGSVAAIICGAVAGRGVRARVGIALGAFGLVAPLTVLFVYCVVLGYPFPIHRFRG